MTVWYIHRSPYKVVTNVLHAAECIANGKWHDTQVEWKDATSILRNGWDLCASSDCTFAR